MGTGPTASASPSDEGTGAAADKVTRLTWSRSTWGGDVKVEASRPGPTLQRAHRDVERLALQLDAIRTLRPHVMWKKITWRQSILQVDAVAESAIYGNLAILVARRVFQGYGSAGSGVQQLRVPKGIRFPWKIKMLLAPPPPSQERRQ